MDKLKKLLLSHIFTLRQYTSNFINYFQSNVTLTQTSHHITFPVIHAKKTSLKLFYLIDRIIRKILIFQLKKPFPLYVSNFYQYGGPVPDQSILELLLTFQTSINERLHILTHVIPRVFRLDHLQFWLNIFQRLMTLLETTHYNIPEQM